MIGRFFSALPARDWVKPSSDIPGMEECKIPAWVRDKMFQDQQGAFLIPTISIFQRRASF
jgi:hypothetical protein